jgi:hypothetical protein
VSFNAQDQRGSNGGTFNVAVAVLAELLARCYHLNFINIHTISTPLTFHYIITPHPSFLISATIVLFSDICHMFYFRTLLCAIFGHVCSIFGHF